MKKNDPLNALLGIGTIFCWPFPSCVWACGSPGGLSKTINCRF